MPHRTLSTRNDYERKINYDWPNEFFLGKQKRDLPDKTGDREDSKKVKESDSLRSLPDVVLSDGLNSGISKIICKLFKKYREPSKGAFYLPLRGKGTPN